MSSVRYCAAVGAEPETYHHDGEDATWWEAAAAAIEEEDFHYDDDTPREHRIVTIAIARRPMHPACVVAHDGSRLVDWIIDGTTDHDDYMGDFCDGFLDAVSKEAQNDLRAEIRATLEEWFKRHNLEPRWYCAERAREIAWPWVDRAAQLAADLDKAGRVRCPIDASRWLTPAAVAQEAAAAEHGYAVELRSHNVWEAAKDAGLMTDAEFASAPKLP